jgi:hypothetical protein
MWMSDGRKLTGDYGTWRGREVELGARTPCGGEHELIQDGGERPGPEWDEVVYPNRFARTPTTTTAAFPRPRSPRPTASSRPVSWRSPTTAAMTTRPRCGSSPRTKQAGWPSRPRSRGPRSTGARSGASSVSRSTTGPGCSAGSPATGSPTSGSNAGTRTRRGRQTGLWT